MIIIGISSEAIFSISDMFKELAEEVEMHENKVNTIIETENIKRELLKMA